MKPTDEQLRDPKWWDENAPEYAASAMLVWETDRKNRLVRVEWAREKEGIVVGQDQYVEHYPRPTSQPNKGPWLGSGFDGGLMKRESTAPQPTDKPEWDGEGLPPVGCECECWDGEEWHLGQSVGPYLGGWLCMLTNNRERPFVGSEGDFRPLKTQAERERDELINIITAHNQLSEGMLADAIIAAGWRKEAE